MVAILLNRYGEWIRVRIEKRLGLVGRARRRRAGARVHHRCAAGLRRRERFADRWHARRYLLSTCQIESSDCVSAAADRSHRLLIVGRRGLAVRCRPQPARRLTSTAGAANDAAARCSPRRRRLPAASGKKIQACSTKSERCSRNPSILPRLKSPQQTIDDLNARARESASRRRQPVAAGQAILDGQRAAWSVRFRQTARRTARSAPTSFARAKGFKEGKSLNTDSAETCSAKVLIPGRKRKPDDCRTDNYVTRALCQ